MSKTPRNFALDDTFPGRLAMASAVGISTATGGSIKNPLLRLLLNGALLGVVAKVGFFFNGRDNNPDNDFSPVVHDCIEDIHSLTDSVDMLRRAHERERVSAEVNEAQEGDSAVDMEESSYRNISEDDALADLSYALKDLRKTVVEAPIATAGLCACIVLVCAASSLLTRKSNALCARILIACGCKKHPYRALGALYGVSTFAALEFNHRAGV